MTTCEKGEGRWVIRFREEREMRGDMGLNEGGQTELGCISWDAHFFIIGPRVLVTDFRMRSHEPHQVHEKPHQI